MGGIHIIVRNNSLVSIFSLHSQGPWFDFPFRHVQNFLRNMCTCYCPPYYEPLVASLTLRNYGEVGGYTFLVRRIRHKQLMHEWAQEHKDWMEEEWRKIVFSYESKFNIVGSDGWEWYWKRHGEPLSNLVVSKTVKHGRGSIMVWGCMSWEGVGELTIIIGKMNNKHYQSILHDNLSMSVVKLK